MSESVLLLLGGWLFGINEDNTASTCSDWVSNLADTGDNDMVTCSVEHYVSSSGKVHSSQHVLEKKNMFMFRRRHVTEHLHY